MANARDDGNARPARFPHGRIPGGYGLLVHKSRLSWLTNISIGVGEGDTGQEFISSDPRHPPGSPMSPSFAPRGLSKIQSSIRRRVSRSLPAVPTADAIARTPHALSVGTQTSSSPVQRWMLTGTLQRAVKQNLRHAENARFLERFRYIIITSQLLNDQVNLLRYAPFDARPASAAGGPPGASALGPPGASALGPSFSLVGVLTTSLAAFFLVWLVDWARGSDQAHLRIYRTLSVFFVALVCIPLLRSHLRRKSLALLRQRALASAGTLITCSQSYDAAAAATLTAIQDVELVARGYRLWVACCSCHDVFIR